MGWQVFEDFQAAPKGTEDFNMDAVKIGRELGHAVYRTSFAIMNFGFLFSISFFRAEV